MKGYSTKLSERELIVLHYLSLGLKPKRIAKATNFTYNQVKRSLVSIYDKLGAFSMLEAINIAMARGTLNRNGRVLRFLTGGYIHTKNIPHSRFTETNRGNSSCKDRGAKKQVDWL